MGVPIRTPSARANSSAASAMAGCRKSAPSSASAGTVRTSSGITSWPWAISRWSRWRSRRPVREEAEGLPETDRTVAMGASVSGVRRAPLRGTGARGVGSVRSTRRVPSGRISQALRACGTPVAEEFSGTPDSKACEGTVNSGEERGDAERRRIPKGRSGRGATGGAGDAREVDVASPREVQSHLHAVDRVSPAERRSRKNRPVSYRGPLNFTKVRQVNP